MPPANATECRAAPLAVAVMTQGSEATNDALKLPALSETVLATPSAQSIRTSAFARARPVAAVPEIEMVWALLSSEQPSEPMQTLPLQDASAAKEARQSAPTTRRRERAR